jgi:hypothetical protein
MMSNVTYPPRRPPGPEEGVPCIFPPSPGTALDGSAANLLGATSNHRAFIRAFSGVRGCEPRERRHNGTMALSSEPELPVLARRGRLQPWSESTASAASSGLSSTSSFGSALRMNQTPCSASLSAVSDTLAVQTGSGGNAAGTSRVRRFRA